MQYWYIFHAYIYVCITHKRRKIDLITFQYFARVHFRFSVLIAHLKRYDVIVFHCWGYDMTSFIVYYVAN